MTINAEKARAQVTKELERKQKFNYLFPQYSDMIDRMIEQGIDELVYSCSIKIVNRPDKFFRKLKDYYEGLGYNVTVSEIINGFGEIESPQCDYREVTLSW